MGITTLYRSIVVFVLSISFAYAQNSNYQLPYYVQARWFRLERNIPPATYDSIYVKGTNGWMATAPRVTWDNLPLKPIVPSTTSQLINNSGFIAAETDPVWSAALPNYRTKLQNDSLYQVKGTYLTAESDPTVPAYLKSITQAQVNAWNTPTYAALPDKPNIPTNNNQLINGAGYLAGESDPLWSAAAANYRTKTQNDGLYYPMTGNPAGFLTDYTETDPTVPVYAKTLTGFNTIKSSTDALYKPIGYAPSSAEIIAGLTYTPYPNTNPSGYLNQAGARSAISVSGNASYNSGTGVISVPADAVSSVHGRTGDVVAVAGDYTTSLVSEGTNQYFTSGRVLATSLAGFSTSVSTAVVATDNVLAAIGKLQAQVNSLGFAVNGTAVGLSRATLNSTYPTAAPRFMVFCPDITLGGAIYIKVTTGSTGRWQTISAPPTL